ncbi:tyrosine-type recombinase/integrase [Pelosinus sp. IPA-1]|uniref:tyrosine-type recombinase/integrase n=1 Tax=Pelosinus sp. IPA-1 TaxID=3029569 RepID=UPI0024361EA3|nr:tyrosine-type recombinase/integrase [Pelosinus sp. IPA-1]GMB02084.1 hypothetical protein PIPA1_48840 [Pelosinus sp. IPA-1]
MNKINKEEGIKKFEDSCTLKKIVEITGTNDSVLRYWMRNLPEFLYPTDDESRTKRYNFKVVANFMAISKMRNLTTNCVNLAKAKEMLLSEYNLTELAEEVKSIVSDGDINISSGHLSLANYMRIVSKELNVKTARKFNMYYTKITEKWPTVEDWHRSKEKSIQWLHYARFSDQYWVAWSIFTGNPLPLDFLKFFEVQEAIKFLNYVGVDIHSMEKKYNNRKHVKNICGNLLRIMLMTGKHHVEDFTIEDIDMARDQGIISKHNIYKFYNYLYDLKIIGTDIPETIWSEISSRIFALPKDDRDRVIVEMIALKKNKEFAVTEGGHLSCNEFMGCVCSEIKRMSTRYYDTKGLYNFIISTWPTVEDWFNSKERTKYYNEIFCTDVYWVVWSLSKRKPLEVQFLRQLRTQNIRRYLKVLGIFQNFDETEKKLFAEGCKSNIFYPTLLRHLLLSGKRFVNDLTPEDVNRAESEDIGCTTTGYYLIRLALYLLQITNIPPITLHHAEKKRKKDSPIPLLYRDIGNNFIQAMSRRRFNPETRREKTLHLGTFLNWWVRLHSDNTTLQSISRRNWLDYIEYITVFKKDASPKTQAHWLSAIPTFFEWGWTDCPEDMPKPFEISSGDYQVISRSHKTKGNKAFDDSRHGDVLIRYIINLKPDTIVGKMKRAAAIIQATSGARAGEVERLPIDSWRFDEEDKVYKLILVTIDKMNYRFRPILITEEGKEAIREIEIIRRELGNLAPRYDQRIKESYVHLFEYRGRLVCTAFNMENFLNDCKIECGLVTEDGNPVKGGTHAFRHRFGRRVFEIAKGDLKVVQHLLGHIRISMSEHYVTEDKARRNASLRDEIIQRKLTGRAKETLLWLLEQNLTIPAYLAWQRAMDGAGTLGELIKIGQARNLGYGWCINPCVYFNKCFVCQNFLAEEDHIPYLKELLVEHFQELSYAIHVNNDGDINKAMENTKTRRTFAHINILAKQLEELGVYRKEINKLLGRGE